MSSPGESVIDNVSLCTHAPFGIDLLPSPDQASLVPPDATQRLAALRGHLKTIAASPHEDDELFVHMVNQDIRSRDLPYWPHRLRELTTKQPMDWLLGASDTELLGFIADNADRQRMNQLELMRLLPTLKEQALHNVDMGIEHGVVPRTARPLAEITLDQTTYIALDTIGSAEFFCRAYYNDTGIMGIANAYDRWRDTTDLSRVFTHELYHGINMRANAGLHKIVPRKALPELRLAEEVWTEHATQTSIYGKPTIIDPEMRPNDDQGSYRLDRVLGSIVFATIPHDLIGEAYLEPLVGDKFPARREVDRQLRYNYPEYASRRRGNILHRIAAEEAAAPRSQRAKILDKWINALWPITLTELEEPADDRTDVIFVTWKEPQTSS